MEEIKIIIEAIFVASIVLALFAYIGYPLSLLLIGLFYRRSVVKDPISPSVTIIVTVHNEVTRVRHKIANILSLEYPKDKMQILVASDGSSDDTNKIVKEYPASIVELLELTERRGKEAAQKVAVKNARGDILVFTDVATMLEPDALKQIVSNFADPSVGCVSSADRLIGKNGKPAGEGIYVHYEMWLRRIESYVNSLVGLSGSFFAARKEVCADFSGEMQSDFRTVLNAVKLGLRGISDPHAIGWYEDIVEEKKEFNRKVRTVVRGLTVFFRHLEFLDVFKYGLFSYQYFCHKFLRWLVPVSLVFAFLSNIALAIKSPWWSLSLALQVVFYSLSVFGLWKGASYLGFLSKLPTYFVTVNASILVAWIRFLKGERITMWAPSKR
jgi:cellulose synthase/poly-beta-1,6-N-acetylglucosamine synthase-like glycosyltransferase